jgi:hypothetical protein
MSDQENVQPPLDAAHPSLAAARDGIEAALKAELARLLDGTVDAVDGPIRQAANRLLFAAQRGRRDLADEARDQLALALEERRLAARAGLEATLAVVLGRGVGLLFDGLAAGLAGLGSRK